MQIPWFVFFILELPKKVHTFKAQNMS